MTILGPKGGKERITITNESQGCLMKEHFHNMERKR